MRTASQATALLIATLCGVITCSACQPTQRPTPPILSSTAFIPVPATPTPARSAELSELRSEVSARTTAAQEWQTAVEGQAVFVGGAVKTGAAARARLDITDGTILRLGANTQFELKELSPVITDPVTRLKLLTGKLWLEVTAALGRGAFEIETPAGIATVRGSFLSVEFTPATGQMLVTCLDGQCRLTGTSGKFMDLTAEQQAEIPGVGQDPSPAQPMEAAQFADWAQNFPGAPIPTLTPSPTSRPTATSTPQPTVATLVPPLIQPPASSATVTWLLPDGCSPVSAGSLVIGVGVGRWQTPEEAQAVVGDSIPTVTVNGTLATFIERTGPEWHTGYGDPGWGFSARAQITLAAGVYDVVGEWINPDYTQRCTLTVNP